MSLNFNSLLNSNSIPENLSIHQLKTFLSECISNLHEKQNDLFLAAQLGQELLLKNQDLESKISKIQSKDSQNTLILELENELHALNSQLETNAQELTNAKESEKLSIKQLSQTQSSLSETALELEFSNSQIHDLKSQLKSLQSKIIDLESIISKDSLTILNISRTNESLSVELNNSSLQNQSLINSIQEVQNQNSNLQLQISELKLMNEKYQQYQIQSENQQEIIDELQWTLEKSRESNNSLLARLSDSSAGPTSNPTKTLLSEVDEKRKDAEQMHSVLSEKHDGLLKTHSVTVIHQERMRNQISRLTQLSQNQSAEHRVSILEDALSQALSEKQMLEFRLLSNSNSYNQSNDDLDASIYLNNNSDSDSDSHAHLKNSDNEHLLFRISQLTIENDNHLKNLKTLQLIKLNESDKVIRAYQTLHERETEIDQLRCLLAKTQFDLDEIKLLNQHHQDYPDTGLDIKSIQDADIHIVEAQDVTSDMDIVATNSHDDSDSANYSPTKSPNSNSPSQIHDAVIIDNSYSSDSNPESNISDFKSDATFCDSQENKKSKNIKLDRSKVGECNQQ